MRFPFSQIFVRTLYSIGNTTFRAPPSPFTSLARPGTALRTGMPIPFIGSLFSTAESRKMSHPVQKSDGEWQAQLNPGMSRQLPFDSSTHQGLALLLQNAH